MDVLDPELDALVRDVIAVFGADVEHAANLRAFDRAAWARDQEAAEWLQVFYTAWKDELRRLLRPH